MASALASVRELRPDVVLLDVLLPDMTGFAVAKELAAAPDRPLVVLTSSRSAADLGALVCTAANPRCPACPIADMCAWRTAGHPAYDGPPRKVQTWAGTDRQCRGRLLAVLRDTDYRTVKNRIHDLPGVRFTTSERLLAPDAGFARQVLPAIGQVLPRTILHPFGPDVRLPVPNELAVFGVVISQGRPPAARLFSPIANVVQVHHIEGQVERANVRLAEREISGVRLETKPCLDAKLAAPR